MSVEIIGPEENKTVINHMPIYMRSVDRTMKNIKDWWESLQSAESVYYPNRAALYDIYATVIIDAFLSGIIDKRIKTVVNKNIYYKKGDKKVDALDDLIDSEKFKELRKQRMLKYFYGLQGWEFIPGKEFDYKTIPIKHIYLQQKLITKEQWGLEGKSYDGVWNIVVIGKENDFGLLLKCAPLALWKKGDMGDWAQFIEIFGQPFIMFLYNGYDEKTKKELETALDKMGSGTKMQLPKEIEPKIFDGKQSNGDGGLQDKFRIACNQEMSVVILGATETTVSSSSSGYAQSKEHGKQQDEVIADDCDDELKFFNSPAIIQIIKSYGFPVGDGGYFVYEKEEDIEQMKSEIVIDSALEKLGVPLGHDYYYEKYNRPKPANYDELIAAKEADKIAQREAINNNNPKPSPKDKKPAKKKQDPADQAAEATWWEKFRLTLADFFDPARQD